MNNSGAQSGEGFDPLRIPRTTEEFLRLVGHPPRWKDADKCLLTAMLAAPLASISLLVNYSIYLHPEETPYYNHSFMPGYLAWHAIVIAGWLVIGLAGFLKRGRPGKDTPFIYVTSQFACITTSVFLYFPGYFTTPYLTGLLGGGIMLVMFFDTGPALWGIGSLMACYLGASILIINGLIPAAPLVNYVPYENGRLAPVWATVSSVYCLIVMTLMFGVMVIAVYQWRRREAKIEKLSKTDPLTGLPNRRHFFNTLQNEVARALRNGRPLAFVICDTDRFKTINDTYGHQAGDEVLQRIADIMRSNLRMGIDTVGRIGGDEFAMVLTETDLAGAKLLANRIAEAVRREYFDRNGKRFSASLSIGIVGRQEGPVNVDTLIEAADTLLYHAKRDGRDRIAATELSAFLSTTDS